MTTRSVIVDNKAYLMYVGLDGRIVKARVSLSCQARNLIIEAAARRMEFGQFASKAARVAVLPENKSQE